MQVVKDKMQNTDSIIMDIIYIKLLGLIGVLRNELVDRFTVA